MKTENTQRQKAYSYVRFSSIDQRKGGSIDRQTEKTLKYVKDHNLELDTTLNLMDVGVYPLLSGRTTLTRAPRAPCLGGSSAHRLPGFSDSLSLTFLRDFFRKSKFLSFRMEFTTYIRELLKKNLYNFRRSGEVIAKQLMSLRDAVQNP